MAHAAWNERALDRPVINTQLQPNSKLDLAALRALLDRGIDTTFATAKFNEVAALASRLIVRRAPSFRAQYGFKLMRKTNIALCRLHECNVRDALAELRATLPAYRAASTAALELPTRDCFDYVLVRVHSLAALLFRIASCARRSSELFLFYLHRRYFLETAVLHVAVLSEVWQLAQRLCASTVQFYDALRPYAGHFGGRQTWLAAGVQLPDRLGDALGDEWLEECRRARQGDRMAKKSSLDDVMAGPADALFGFGDADQDCIVDVPADEAQSSTLPTVRKPPPKVQIAKVEQPLLAATPSRSLLLTADDIGVAVARNPPAGAAGQGKPTMRLEQLVSTDDVQAFVKAERTRLTAAACKPSERLSADRWKEVQRKVNHILVTTQGRNTVKAFRKYWTQTVLNKK